MKLKLAVIMSLLISTAYAEQQQELNVRCIASSSFGGFQSEALATNVLDLFAVSESAKRRVDLTNARITYGMFGVGAGNAAIYLNVSDGKIVDLNIDATVGMLGMNSHIKEKITISELMDGDPLQFYMEGSDKPALKVTPSSDFGETGGKATLEIWDGDRYKKETIVISKASGDYKVYLNSVATSNRISGIKINMRGYSIPNMYVDSYSINTN